MAQYWTEDWSKINKIFRKLKLFRLNNKIAIITGSASGFGKGIAEKFTKEGANLILVDLNSDNIINVLDIIQLVNIILN